MKSAFAQRSVFEMRQSVPGAELDAVPPPAYGAAQRFAEAAVSSRCFSAHRAQMHTLSRAARGTRSSAFCGMFVEKHQHSVSPRAMPHSFGSPHSAHRVGSGLVVM